MKARIYKPVHTAMQSGKASHTQHWTVEFLPTAPLFVDPLMGWTGQTDTTQQLEMTFESEQAAIDYAKRNGLEYELQEPKMRIIKPKAYASNFVYNRVE